MQKKHYCRAAWLSPAVTSIAPLDPTCHRPRGEDLSWASISSLFYLRACFHYQSLKLTERFVHNWQVGVSEPEASAAWPVSEAGASRPLSCKCLSYCCLFDCL